MKNGQIEQIAKINSAFAELQRVIIGVLSENPNEVNPPSFEDDRKSKPEAAKIVGVSIPTLDKLIKVGKFKQHNLGNRKYFLKSELLAALRSHD